MHLYTYRCLEVGQNLICLWCLRWQFFVWCCWCWWHWLWIVRVWFFKSHVVLLVHWPHRWNCVRFDHGLPSCKKYNHIHISLEHRITFILVVLFGHLVSTYHCGHTSLQRPHRQISCTTVSWILSRPESVLYLVYLAIHHFSVKVKIEFHTWETGGGPEIWKNCHLRCATFTWLCLIMICEGGSRNFAKVVIWCVWSAHGCVP